ncbi:cell adhesion molecule CEACAM6-like [Paramisgurnus dabryanus]|uniref:cell adhesion molecule CEACAM6-like n=1 Tax=Paramisgurnus dabryanus TaxID=90735 RepID=UPI003CCF63AB
MMFPHGLYWTLLMLYIGQCFSKDLQFQEFNGATGKNVVFAPEDLPYIPSQIIFITWAFGVDNILTFNNGENKVSQDYEGRVNLNTTTAALELKNLRLNDSGSYKLTVITTPQTYTGQTSLKVYETVSDTTLTSLQKSLIENVSSANITCEGSGDITSVEWMKDNNPLTPSNRIIFSSDNRSVLFSPVNRSDSGEYQCTLRNPASSETANLRLIINYGPENVFINGLNEVDLGRLVSLSCSATSVPSASFTWRFNGSDTGVTTNTFTIDKSDITHSGDYICTAYNDVTEKNVSQRHLLVVKEGGVAGGGLSTGAIVGIVIGVLVAVAGICGLIFYFVKTNKMTKVRLSVKGPANKAPHRNPEAEFNYVDISHAPKADGGGVNLGNTNESRTEYAQITHGISGKPRAPPPPYGSQPSNPSSLPEGITYAQMRK